MTTMLRMRPRTPFNMKESLLNSKIIDQQSWETSERSARNSSFTIVPLRKAVDLIYGHITELTKSDESLREDVLNAGLGNPVAQEKIKATISNLMTEYRIEVDERTIIDGMTGVESIFAQTCGASLIEDLYRQKEVEEVQVNGRRIFLVINGESQLHHRQFDSLEDVRLLQERLSLCGKKPISEKNPVLQSYMYNRSRLVMAREPYSDQPTINIRNFIVRDVTLDSLVHDSKTLNVQMAELLRLLVQYHASQIVGGSTNTGKTTFLFALCNEIPVKERIVTLEKEFEISLRERLKGVRNIVALREVEESRLHMEEAFKPILVMSPKWVIIGEAKGSEVSQMIQGSLRGHDIMGTMHVKYRQSFISDVIDMVKQDGRHHDDDNLKSRIARAFNVLIFLRIVNVNGTNRRVVTEITELYADEQDRVFLNPLVLWNFKANNWAFTGNKLSAALMDHMIQHGAREQFFERLGVY